MFAGIYIARETVRVIGKLVEQRLGKPSLVRETSRTTGVVGFIRSMFAKTKNQKEELSDVVLQPDLTDRVHELATATRNAVSIWIFFVFWYLLM